MYTQCISQLLYVKILQFFVFIRIIKIIHVGLGCHLGFNFVHQFCLQKVKKKQAFIIGRNHRNQPEQNEYHLHSIDHNERLNEQQVCVYTSLYQNTRRRQVYDQLSGGKWPQLKPKVAVNKRIKFLPSPVNVRFHNHSFLSAYHAQVIVFWRTTTKMANFSWMSRDLKGHLQAVSR